MLFAQAQAFMTLPYAEEALRLRRYDDLAKVPGLATPPLDHYLSMVNSVTLVADHALAARLSAMASIY